MINLPPDSPFHTLSWWRLRADLTNILNDFASQHPYFIFHAIARKALTSAGLKDRTDLFLHPRLEPLPKRISLGTFALDFIFPRASELQVGAFACALRKNVAEDPNFSLAAIHEPEARNAEDALADASARLDLHAPEICLEFLAPIEIPQFDRSRPWMLNAEELWRLCLVHLASLFPQLELSSDHQQLPSICRLLPYYWDFVHSRHKSKSQKGETQHLKGWMGPVYLKGNWQPLFPLLALCAELHTGRGKGKLGGIAANRNNPQRPCTGLGAFRLCQDRPFFDTLLEDPDQFQTVREELLQESAVSEELQKHLDGGISLAAETHRETISGHFESQPLRQIDCDKASGGTRAIVLLPARERILHDVLHRLLSPVIDRMFETASIGFRPGHSRDTARHRIRAAVREGATHAVRADIDSFFDSVEWERLARVVDQALPYGDALTRKALTACWQAPVRIQGKPQQRRHCGLPQGSPLSPLLANLFLDGLDEHMEARGFHLIRFADDFLILTCSLEEAEDSLATARNYLSGIGLALHDEKTSIVEIAEGFHFLGMDLPERIDEEIVVENALRKPVHILNQYGFTCLDGRSLVLRRKGVLAARVPAERISEIVFYGDGAVSQRLMQFCARERIPVSFCTRAGWHTGTLRPDSKTWFARVARHHARHRALGNEGRLRIAKGIVDAKLRNYQLWMRSLPGTPPLRKEIDKILAAIPRAESVEALRGMEGLAARKMFGMLNSRIRNEHFRSDARIPRSKPDALNAVLDCLYSRLFTRLNVLLHGAGLDPYLGCLHSGKDHYESFVCDLQEPFRARMDRLAVKLINYRTVKEEDAQETEGRWFLSSAAFGAILEAFAREENVRLAGEKATLGRQLIAQVHSIRDWVEEKIAAPSFLGGKLDCQNPPKPGT